MFGVVGGKQTKVGEGKVDFRHLLEQLKGFGYEGDIVIEHEMVGREDRTGDIIDTKNYLENLIAEIF